MKTKTEALVFSFAVLGFLAIASAGCDQVITRHYGGTTTINLPCGQKYLNASWKSESGLWYAYRPAVTGETFTTVIYQESSTMGVLQGRVLFNERSC